MGDELEALSASVQRSLEQESFGGAGLVQRVAARLFSDDLQSTVEKFVDNNVQHFTTLTPEQIAAGENQLRWWSSYQSFIALFDRSLDELVAAEGGTPEEFARLCEDESRLSEDERMVLELLRASSEYTAFLQLMYDEVEDRGLCEKAKQ
jgi:hypothetical protein